MQLSQAEHHQVAFTASAEADRKAYNAAFRELGLPWRWDADTFQDLLRIPGEIERISAYLETRQANLLSAYETEFLSGLIYATKQRCHEAANDFAPTAAPFDDVQ